jgi:hypothetical protein
VRRACRFHARPLVAALVLLVAGLGGGASGSAQTATGCPASPGWQRLSEPRAPVTDISYGPNIAVPPERIRSVSTSPDPKTLFTGGEYGVYQSLNCGGSWKRFLLPNSVGRPSRTGDFVDTLAVAGNGTIFVGDDGALMVSRDGGGSWQTLGSLNGRSLAPSRAAPGLVYAIFDFVSLRGLPGIARSWDDGRTWQRIRSDPTSGAIAADPEDPATAYLGVAVCAESTRTGCVRQSGRLDVSHDGGETFSAVASFPARITGLATTGDSGRFWMTTEDARLYGSQDGGATWSVVSGGPTTGAFISLAVSQTDTGLVFIVTDAGELWMYRESRRLGLPRTGGGAFREEPVS